MLTKLQRMKDERESGFTLIELLVVILIIGILSAIAIPAFLNQRKAAVDSSLQADLANSAKQIEGWGVKQGAAVKDLPVGLTSSPVKGSVAFDGDQKINLSDGTQLAFAGKNTGYCIQGWNEGGSLTGEAGKFLAYDSLAGGMLKDSSSAQACPATVLSTGLVAGVDNPDAGNEVDDPNSVTVNGHFAYEYEADKAFNSFGTYSLKYTVEDEHIDEGWGDGYTVTNVKWNLTANDLPDGKATLMFNYTEAGGAGSGSSKVNVVGGTASGTLERGAKISGVTLATDSQEGNPSSGSYVEIDGEYYFMRIG